MAFDTPVAGFPNKTEAIKAFHAQGMTPFMIAERIGSTPASVSERLRQLRRDAGDGTDKRYAANGGGKKRPGQRTRAERAEANAKRDTRGIWTPEKLEKARRLFGKTMLYIAEALEVPPMELMEYGLKGVLPPMGEGQRVAQLLEDLSNRENDNGTAALRADVPETADGPAAAEPAAADPAGQESMAAPAADPLGEEVEPDREDDEAELARLAEVEDEDDADKGSEPEPVTPRADEKPAPAATPRATPTAPEPGHQYYLTDEAGQWLHESLEALTKNRKYAWKGTTKKIAIVLQRMPKWKVLVPERVG